MLGLEETLNTENENENKSSSCMDAIAKEDSVDAVGQTTGPASSFGDLNEVKVHRIGIAEGCNKKLRF